MRNLTCIVCPVGCSLEIDDSKGLQNLSVTGNKCPRGKDYAIEEIRAPKRTVTATAKIIAAPIVEHTAAEKSGNSAALSIHRVPVKTTSPCLREKIPALLEDIYNVKVTLPVKMGDVLISNWNGEKFDVIATRTIE